MKKTLLAVIMGIIMISLVSCSSSRRGVKRSKILKQTEQIINEAVKEVNQASDCEELENATFNAVIGLIFVPDIDKMSPEEEAEFDKILEKLSRAYEYKKDLLGCVDEDEDDGGE